MVNSHKQLVFCRQEDWDYSVLSNIVIGEDSLTLLSGESMGFICLKAVDSGEKGFNWSRVTLDCLLHVDSVILLYAYSSDSKIYGDNQNLCTYLSKFNNTEELKDIFSFVGTGDDFYIGMSGRYLWIMLEFISTGLSPVLSALRLKIAGDHMMDHLPGIYGRTGDFTKRFLSVFDGVYIDMERAIYGIPALLNYENTNGQMLRYLAGWVCVEPDEPDDKILRNRVRNAFNDYETMYTVSGIKKSVEKLCSKVPVIIENMDAYPFDRGSTDFDAYKRLYGDNPYKFFILLEDDTFATAAAMEKFINDMKNLIPADTEFELVLLKRCVRLGGHTYLGINTMVSDYTMILIDENTTIRYDTMIGGYDVK